MKLLGKMPAKSEVTLLRFAQFVKGRNVAMMLPPKYDFWKGKAKFPGRIYMNDSEGDCTRASQANLATRMERIETKRTINLNDEEISRVYNEMTTRLYGGGDTGAYEIDALNCWRNPDHTFKDEKGRPLTIDAYTRINQLDHDEIKLAIYAAGAKGIKLCINLPEAYQSIDPPNPWVTPLAGPLTGIWLPGSWGGHSLMANAYDSKGIRLVHTWYKDPQLHEQWITWEAIAAYCDEAYSIVDSIDSWRKSKVATSVMDLPRLKVAVNDVSSVKIK